MESLGLIAHQNQLLAKEADQYQKFRDLKFQKKFL
jgi:hypothetical protein